MYLYSCVPLIFQFCIGAVGFLITRARTQTHVIPYLNVILDPRLYYSDLKRAPDMDFQLEDRMKAVKHCRDYYLYGGPQEMFNSGQICTVLGLSFY